MNSVISDIALDLGPFALDLECECEMSNGWASENSPAVMCKNALGPRRTAREHRRKTTRCPATSGNAVGIITYSVCTRWRRTGAITSPLGALLLHDPPPCPTRD